MKIQIAIYDTHEKAINAIKLLAYNDFPMDQVSLLGKADVIDENIHVQPSSAVENAPVLLGAGAGIIVGLLTGMGVFAIPGFGFLYGAGAWVGAMGGFDLGIITGGIGNILSTIGLNTEHVDKFHAHLNEGNFLVMVNGSLEEIEKAISILKTDGTSLDVGY
jgi:hypothetical protein